MRKLVATTLTFAFRSLEATSTLRNWPTFMANLMSETLAYLWPAFFEAVALHRSETMTFLLRSGKKLITRRGSRDWEAVLDVWYAECYTPHGIEIREDDVIVDVGAHIGAFTVYASTKAKKGKVIAYEPDPANYAVLQSNLKENSSANVVCFDNAVAGDKGKVELFLSDRSLGHSMFHELVDGPETGRVLVEATDLRGVFERNDISKIDLLKMNCEGAEYQIIFNCPREYLEKITKMSIQYHDIDGQRNGRRLGEYLGQNGYDVEFSKSGFRILYAKSKKSQM